jgi:HAMP domain-containing protein
VGWEVDVVNQFRGNAELKEFVGSRDTPDGAVRCTWPGRCASPTRPACAATAASRPRPRPWSTSTAGQRLRLADHNEVIGAQIVSVPLPCRCKRAEKSFNVFVGSLVAVFVVVGVVLNLMIWLVVVRPVTRLSALADRVSQGDLDAPEFPGGQRRDEIGVLAQSFSRMRTSVVQAMKMLDS